MYLFWEINDFQYLIYLFHKKPMKIASNPHFTNLTSIQMPWLECPE